MRQDFFVKCVACKILIPILSNVDSNSTTCIHLGFWTNVPCPQCNQFEWGVEVCPSSQRPVVEAMIVGWDQQDYKAEVKRICLSLYQEHFQKEGTNNGRVVDDQPGG